MVSAAQDRLPEKFAGGQSGGQQSQQTAITFAGQHRPPLIWRHEPQPVARLWIVRTSSELGRVLLHSRVGRDDEQAPHPIDAKAQPLCARPCPLMLP